MAHAEILAEKCGRRQEKQMPRKEWRDIVGRFTNSLGHSPSARKMRRGQEKNMGKEFLAQQRRNRTGRVFWRKIMRVDRLYRVGASPPPSPRVGLAFFYTPIRAQNSPQTALKQPWQPTQHNNRYRTSWPRVALGGIWRWCLIWRPFEHYIW